MQSAQCSLNIEEVLPTKVRVRKFDTIGEKNALTHNYSFFLKSVLTL